MDGEDVYGNKVSVSYPTSVRNWDKSYSPYKMPGKYDIIKLYMCECI